MKKAGIMLVCGLLAALVVGLAGSANARPEYKKVHDARYKDAKIAEQLKDAKCNSCHYGKKKDMRNDYGKALIKAGLTEENYKKYKEDKKENADKATEALNKQIKEALEKVLKEKNEAGETFGERIEAGKLPGTAPEE